jgi:hypothetical protein
MKNKEFTKKTVAERQNHLIAILKHYSGGALDDAMIGSILPSIAIDKQYTILTFDNIEKLMEEVKRDKSDSSIKIFMFSQAGQPTVAAVLTNRESDRTEKIYRAIHIYAPNPYYLKGVVQ